MKIKNCLIITVIYKNTLKIFILSKSNKKNKLISYIIFRIFSTKCYLNYKSYLKDTIL